MIRDLITVCFYLKQQHEAEGVTNQRNVGRQKQIKAFTRARARACIIKHAFWTYPRVRQIVLKEVRKKCLRYWRMSSSVTRKISLSHLTLSLSLGKKTSAGHVCKPVPPPTCGWTYTHVHFFSLLRRVFSPSHFIYCLLWECARIIRNTDFTEELILIITTTMTTISGRGYSC